MVNKNKGMKCPHCNKAFKSVSGLKKHIDSEHWIFAENISYSFDEL